MTLSIYLCISPSGRVYPRWRRQCGGGSAQSRLKHRGSGLGGGGRDHQSRSYTGQVERGPFKYRTGIGGTVHRHDRQRGDRSYTGQVEMGPFIYRTGREGTVHIQDRQRWDRSYAGHVERGPFIYRTGREGTVHKNYRYRGGNVNYYKVFLNIRTEIKCNIRYRSLLL